MDEAETLFDEVRFLWDEYGAESDANMTMDARELAGRVRAFVQEIKAIGTPQPAATRCLVDEWEDYTQQPPTRPRPVPIVSSYHTWENEMDEAFDAIMATDETVEVKAAGITHGGVLRGVMSELKVGGMGIGQIIALIPVIVDMIQTYGPVVAEIVKKIREMFEKK